MVMVWIFTVQRKEDLSIEEPSIDLNLKNACLLSFLCCCAVCACVHAPISVWFLSLQQIVQHEWIGLSVLGRVEVKYKKGGNGVPAPQWGQQKPDYLPSKNGAGSARNKLRFWVTRPVLPEGLDGTIWALKVEARRIRRFSMDLHLNLHMK